MNDPHDDNIDDDGSRLRDRLESLLPNVIRRTVSTGVGAKQYTEDVIRGALQDVKLPREAVNHLIDVADNTKKEVVRVAAREFREFLESAKFNEELAKILTQLSFEIKTEIRFIPNDQALKPMVTTQTRMKTDGGASVDASEETNASINEAVRSNATELVEMMLGKVLRSGLKDTGEHAAAEKDRRGAAVEKRGEEKKAAEKKASEKAAADSASRREKATAEKAAAEQRAADKIAADRAATQKASEKAAADKAAADKAADAASSASAAKPAAKSAAKPAPKRRKSTGTSSQSRSKTAKTPRKSKADSDDA